MALHQERLGTWGRPFEVPQHLRRATIYPRHLPEERARWPSNFGQSELKYPPAQGAAPPLQQLPGSCLVTGTVLHSFFHRGLHALHC